MRAFLRQSNVKSLQFSARGHGEWILGLIGILPSLQDLTLTSHRILNASIPQESAHRSDTRAELRDLTLVSSIFDTKALACLLSTYSVHTLVLKSCTWHPDSSSLDSHHAKTQEELEALLQRVVSFVYLHDLYVVPR
jgi:hypothetical protein